MPASNENDVVTPPPGVPPETVVMNASGSVDENSSVGSDVLSFLDIEIEDDAVHEQVEVGRTSQIHPGNEPGDDGSVDGNDSSSETIVLSDNVQRWLEEWAGTEDSQILTGINLGLFYELFEAHHNIVSRVFRAFAYDEQITRLVTMLFPRLVMMPFLCQCDAFRSVRARGVQMVPPTEYSEPDEETPLNPSGQLIASYPRCSIRFTRALFAGQSFWFTSDAMLRWASTSREALEVFEYFHIYGYGGLFLSLVVDQLYYFVNYPEYRADHSLFEILGLSVFKGHEAQCGTVAGQADIDCSLANPVVLLLVIGAPLLFAVIKAIFHLIETKRHRFDVLAQEARVILEDYESSKKRDILRWLAPKYVRPLWPYKIYNALERVVFAINWDATLTPAERYELYESLAQFCGNSRYISRIKGLYALAAVVYDVSLRNFKILKEYGNTTNALQKLLVIKTEALQLLKRHLDKEDIDTWFPTRLVVRYLLWELGEAQTRYECLPFSIFKVSKTYVKIALLIGLIRGTIYAIEDAKGRKQCKKEHSVDAVWKFPPATGTGIGNGKQCFVCQDWDIPWRDQLSEQSCTNSYLLSKRDPDDLIAKFNQSTFYLERVKEFDFSQQRWTGEELSRILSVLNRASQIEVLSLNHAVISDQGHLPLAAIAVSAIKNYLQGVVLKGLDLSHLRIGDAELSQIGESFSTGLVEELNLSYNWIHDLPALITMLSTSTRLRMLNLECSYFGGLGNETLTVNFPASLQELHLRDCKLTAAGLQVLMPVLSRVTQLEALSLRGNFFDALGSQPLTAGFPPSLKTLNLFSNKLTPAGVRELMIALSNSKQLQRLVLGGNYFRDPGLQPLIDYFPASLQALYLDTCYLTSAALKMLMPVLSNAANLRELWIWDNNFSDSGIQPLVEHFPTNLEKLDISYCRLSPDDLKKLMPVLSQATQLQWLGLGGNLFGDTGIQPLIDHFPATLQGIDLCHSNLTAVGLQTLMPVLSRAKQLQVLRLYGNFFDGLGFQQLSANFPATLQELNLYQCKLTATGVNALISALPGTAQLQQLDLGDNFLGNSGAVSIAHILSPCTIREYPFWFERIANPSSEVTFQNKYEFEYLSLATNGIGDEGAEAICQSIPYTSLSNYMFDQCDIAYPGICLYNNPVSETAISDCGFDRMPDINQYPMCPSRSAAVSVQPNWSLNAVIAGIAATVSVFSAFFSDQDGCLEKSARVPNTLSEKDRQHLDALSRRVNKLHFRFTAIVDDQRFSQYLSSRERGVFNDAMRDLALIQERLMFFKQESALDKQEMKEIKREVVEIQKVAPVSDETYHKAMGYVQRRINKIDGVLAMYDPLVKESRQPFSKKEYEHFDGMLDFCEYLWGRMNAQGFATLNTLRFLKKQLKCLESDTMQTIKSKSLISSLPKDHIFWGIFSRPSSESLLQTNSNLFSKSLQYTSSGV